ncbi:PREDICTED: ammonium transporter Rh type B isoform X2 [Polistes dominula]|uniref:Ammonium transporter Rh type B isoform X2 n=1 Tax=Polistes dominula TaxID=743375 RepID=A0ABM1J5L8_POLDO|nr:PREDICTED: ammonium transporter Rh type B isoform X2 [Polistes dominula]
MGKGMLSVCGEKQQVVLLFLIEIILIVLIGTLTTYGPEANANLLKNLKEDYNGNNEHNRKPQSDSLRIYPNVHVMIWIGFGYLMTFLKRYGQSAIGLTFLISAVLVQVALICEGVLHFDKNNKAYLSLSSLLSADVAVAAPLISMGALLGKTTYMQLVFMGIVELIVYTINKYINEHHLMAVDAGDSMYVHAFGAYFGLAVSFVFGRKDKPKEHHLEGPSYQSDIFAMIGTVFLWLFWPSFNSASLDGDSQQRAIINTLLSISGSCVIAFATSALISKDNKFNMVHVQNSTLAGGVAIGTAAGMMCKPIGALIIGSLAGLLSVLGYKYLTPFIQKRLRIHDTCGVHNLHGMPGVLAGIFGAIMAALATQNSYDYSLYEIFPARAPNFEKLTSEMRNDYGILPGNDRTALEQAGYQILALTVTLLMASISGVITGLILRTSVCGSVAEEDKFDDAVHWELEEEEEEEGLHEISKIKERNSRANDQLPMGTI